MQRQPARGLERLPPRQSWNARLVEHAIADDDEIEFFDRFGAAALSYRHPPARPPVPSPSDRGHIRLQFDMREEIMMLGIGVQIPVHIGPIGKLGISCWHGKIGKRIAIARRLSA